MSDSKDASMKRREFLKGIGAAAGAAALAGYDTGGAQAQDRPPSAPRREDPLVGFHYALELGGRVAGYFTEVSGLGSESEAVEYRVGEESGPVRKIPGRLKWSDITLKRPATTDLAVWRWRQLVIEDNVESARSNGDVVALNRQGEQVARWHFENGWPSVVEAYEDARGLLVEVLKIVHEGIQRTN